jgi:hypothetical protein
VIPARMVEDDRESKYKGRWMVFQTSCDESETCFRAVDVSEGCCGSTVVEL